MLNTKVKLTITILAIIFMAGFSCSKQTNINIKPITLTWWGVWDDSFEIQPLIEL